MGDRIILATPELGIDSLVSIAIASSRNMGVRSRGTLSSLRAVSNNPRENSQRGEEKS